MKRQEPLLLKEYGSSLGCLCMSCLSLGTPPAPGHQGTALCLTLLTFNDTNDKQGPAMWVVWNFVPLSVGDVGESSLHSGYLVLTFPS